MSNIIDRRKDGGGKSSPNRKRFIGRIKGQIKKAIPDVVNNQKSIKDFAKKGKTVSIPVKGVNEPILRNDPKLGKRNTIIPGNDKYIPGDTHPKPKGEEQGGGGPDSDETQDEFMVDISMEEFMDVFFEDLELPNLTQKLTKPSIEDFTLKFAGQTREGIPPRINVLKTFENSIGRNLAIKASLKRQIEKLEKECEDEECEKKLKYLIQKLEKLKRKKVTFIDDIDLRYDHYILEPKPITSCVMFAIMDVSGSMGKEEKSIAKIFFLLLYYFLIRQYKQVEIVFIRHHHDAKEVDHDEFFNSRESGGTVVSPALELMRKIIDERYPLNQWNVYGCQVSDGGNFSHDYNNSYNVLVNSIMPICQYFTYIQIGQSMNNTYFGNTLWNEYNRVSDEFKNFQMKAIKRRQEISGIFREFFKRGN
ncbi:MAG: YeaH/YhbH family protein [Proteobacteria bacterium]|nr:YeaH/YhbH family protein [Pseudomonadota bacterium]